MQTPNSPDFRHFFVDLVPAAPAAGRAGTSRSEYSYQLGSCPSSVKLGKLSTTNLRGLLYLVGLDVILYIIYKLSLMIYYICTYHNTISCPIIMYVSVIHLNKIIMYESALSYNSYLCNMWFYLCLYDGYIYMYNYIR